MAQPQQNITLSAPGYFGLNLEDAPIDLDQRYALRADNAVIDSFGRLGARKGFDTLLASPPHADGQILSFGRVSDSGTTRYIAGVYVPSLDSNQIWEIQNLNTTPTAIVIPLPPSYTLSTANVQIIDFAGKGIIIGGGEMLILESGSLSLVSDGSLILPQDDTGTILATLDFTTATAAYGRLWATGGTAGDETIYYSSLLNPYQWYDGKAVPTSNFNTGGIIDVNEAWPLGRDRIVGISGHNNNLVVFGRNSILVYGNPQGDPAAVGGIFLSDTIKNIGLVDRDARASDGRDLLFVDDTGLRSLGRTVQEQSAQIGDLTRPVRTQIQKAIGFALLSGGVELAFDPTNSLLLVIMRGSNDVWACDTRMSMQDGSYRVTRWPGAPLATAFYDDVSEKLVLGCTSNAPAAEYTGNNDFGGSTYNFTFESPVLSFGDPVRTKFLKQLDYTVVSGLTGAVCAGSWEYVGTRAYEKSKFFTLDGGDANFYDTDAKFNTAEYGTGANVIKTYRLNADASGENVIVKFQATINNSVCSLQQMNIQALLGRIN